MINAIVVSLITLAKLIMMKRKTLIGVLHMGTFFLMNSIMTDIKSDYRQER